MTNIRKIFSPVILILLMAFSAPAYAHKVVLSAYAEGDIIEGEVGFSGGDMGEDIHIDVVDVDGNTLGETKTDADGIFQFKPTQRVIHIFKANLGQGHVATYRMELDDLPDGLGNAKTAAIVSNETSPILPESSSAETKSAIAMDQTVLQSLIAKGIEAELSNLKATMASAVRKETKPLRKEIAAYKEKNDMQSILGGVGYICGMFGVGFYFAARQERKKAEALNAAAAGDSA